MNEVYMTGKRAGLVTLCMTFSERELIPSHNRLRDRYGKLLHRYLGCQGDHQCTGAGGDALVLKGESALACFRLEIFYFFLFLFLSVIHKCFIISSSVHHFPPLLI